MRICRYEHNRFILVTFWGFLPSHDFVKISYLIMWNVTFNLCSIAYLPFVPIFYQRKKKKIACLKVLIGRAGPVVVEVVQPQSPSLEVVKVLHIFVRNTFLILNNVVYLG